jgi:hypothetical protein
MGREPLTTNADNDNQDDDDLVGVPLRGGLHTCTADSHILMATNSESGD